MFSDLIYGVFMISVLYISADLMKKYKTGIIKNNTDLAMYFAKKSFKALKMYKKTKNNTKFMLDRCLKKENMDKYGYELDNEVDEYKLVCMCKNGKMYKILVIFENG